MSTGDRLAAHTVLMSFGVPQVYKDKWMPWADMIYKWAVMDPAVKDHGGALRKIEMQRLRLRPPSADMPELIHFARWVMRDIQVKRLEAEREAMENA